MRNFFTAYFTLFRALWLYFKVNSTFDKRVYLVGRSLMELPSYSWPDSGKNTFHLVFSILKHTIAGLLRKGGKPVLEPVSKKRIRQVKFWLEVYIYKKD